MFCWSVCLVFLEQINGDGDGDADCLVLQTADHMSVLRGVWMTQVIKMLVVVVTVFAICWLPLHAFILLIDFRPDLTEYETISQKHFFVIVYSAVHWLAMSNSCVNPIIYGFLHDSFRVYCWSAVCQYCNHSLVPAFSKSASKVQNQWLISEWMMNKWWINHNYYYLLFLIPPAVYRSRPGVKIKN